MYKPDDLAILLQWLGVPGSNMAAPAEPRAHYLSAPRTEALLECMWEPCPVASDIVPHECHMGKPQSCDIHVVSHDCLLGYNPCTIGADELPVQNVQVGPHA